MAVVLQSVFVPELRISILHPTSRLLQRTLTDSSSLLSIVKLATGSLAVFSPAPITPSLSSKLASLGNRVSYIIAPDLEHHIFLSAWHSAYPTAHFIGPAGLAEKRAEQAKKNDKVTAITFQTVFSEANRDTVRVSDEFDREFVYEFVGAHPNKELVFCHTPSKTLIEADLLFNLPATEQYSRSAEDAGSGWATRLACQLMGTQGDALWQKRAQWYLFSAKNRPSYEKSLQRISGWDFENVVPCHGDSIVGGGKGVFEKVFGWHLEGVAKSK